MAASAAATGAASCVSSVSKMKDAERFTGSLGLKSQEAALVVFGMVALFCCAGYVCGAYVFWCAVNLWQYGVQVSSRSQPRRVRRLPNLPAIGGGSQAWTSST